MMILSWKLLVLICVCVVAFWPCIMILIYQTIMPIGSDLTGKQKKDETIFLSPKGYWENVIRGKSLNLTHEKWYRGAMLLSLFFIWGYVLYVVVYIIKNIWITTKTSLKNYIKEMGNILVRVVKPITKDTLVLIIEAIKKI